MVHCICLSAADSDDVNFQRQSVESRWNAAENMWHLRTEQVAGWGSREVQYDPCAAYRQRNWGKMTTRAGRHTILFALYLNIDLIWCHMHRFMQVTRKGLSITSKENDNSNIVSIEQQIFSFKNIMNKLLPVLNLSTAIDRFWYFIAH